MEVLKANPEYTGPTCHVAPNIYWNVTVDAHVNIIMQIMTKVEVLAMVWGLWDQVGPGEARHPLFDEIEKMIEDEQAT